MFGIHAAIKGLIAPDTANDELTVMNRIYAMLNTKPMPMFRPIPPFTFRADRDAPIMVRMKAESTEAIREWYSI